jgi:hypothetical protein
MKECKTLSIIVTILLVTLLVLSIVQPMPFITISSIIMLTIWLSMCYLVAQEEGDRL